MESEEDDEFTEEEFKPQISLAIEFRAGRHNNRIFACSITCCIEGTYVCCTTRISISKVAGIAV